MRIAFISLLALVLVGCASTAAPKPEPQIIPTLPNDWGSNINLEQTRCTPIAGVFENLGIRQNDSGLRSEDGLLSRNVLARSLSANEIAESVVIYSDAESNFLRAELRGLAAIKIEIEVSCRSGWHVFTFERSGSYMGDGVVEKKYRHNAWFRQDRDGNFIARVLRHAEYEIRFTDITSESSEEWYFF